MTGEEVPFDLDGMPEPPPPAIKKAKEETKSGVAWTRYRAARPHHCDECLTEIHQGWPRKSHAPNDAVYKRTKGTEVTYLCALHGTELKSRDEADKPKRARKQ